MRRRRDDAKRQRVVALVAAGELKVAEAARFLGCHPSTLYRLLAGLGVDPRAARRAYVGPLAAMAEGIGRRLATKARLRSRS